MLARCLALATLSAAGCAALHQLTADVAPEHRVDVRAGQSRVDAKVGDVVYLEVGRGVADPQQDGFRAVVNDRRPERTEWDCPMNTLSYKFRAKAPGEYRVVVYARYPNEEAKTLSWTVTVAE